MRGHPTRSTLHRMPMAALTCGQACFVRRYAPLRELHALLIAPYDEQPAKASTFYARAPDWAEQQGGVAFMS